MSSWCVTLCFCMLLCLLVEGFSRFEFAFFRLPPPESSLRSSRLARTPSPVSRTRRRDGRTGLKVLFPRGNESAQFGGGDSKMQIDPRKRKMLGLVEALMDTEDISERRNILFRYKDFLLEPFEKDSSEMPSGTIFQPGMNLLTKLGVYQTVMKGRIEKAIQKESKLVLYQMLTQVREWVEDMVRAEGGDPSEVPVLTGFVDPIDQRRIGALSGPAPLVPTGVSISSEKQKSMSATGGLAASGPKKRQI
mmetsp:Transcript_20928/g.41754  ORF Transcript_20928/g.41754 Transcript_20928/m.41754 type:complete len:249 (-) Transcript_20928:2-748(-)